ncbi:MAG: hypothetical protein KQH79_04260 [Bacteroidetes bacterium]|nr:hypothetical protein [Bacteroidota bacterium]
MKNTMQKDQLEILKSKIFNHQKEVAQIIDFRPYFSNHYLLKIKIDNINKDNYRLALSNNILTIIMFESVEFNKPVHLHNYKLNDLVQESAYDEVKSIDFTLPEDDFYLIDYKVAYKGILKVTLGKIHRN